MFRRGSYELIALLLLLGRRRRLVGRLVGAEEGLALGVEQRGRRGFGGLLREKGGGGADVAQVVGRGGRHGPAARRRHASANPYIVIVNRSTARRLWRLLLLVEVLDLSVGLAQVLLLFVVKLEDAFESDERDAALERNESGQPACWIELMRRCGGYSR